MQNLLTALLLACLAALSLTSSQSIATADKPINAECPIGMKAIDGTTFAEYAKHTIGFCCPGCDKKFAAWSKEQKDAFVKASLATQGVEARNVTDKEAAAAPNEPYPLTICPVSGKELGSMGKPIVLEADGSQVKLCCKGCATNFKSDTEKYMEVVREGIAAQQLPYYPLETCVVSGERLTEDGKDVAEDIVIGNRLFRVCCKSCIKVLRKDPGKYLAELDAAVIKEQAEHYPLSTCIVREKSKLGSMGDPVQRVVGNRLVQFCCKGCEPAFNEDPVKFLATVDAAWAEDHHEHGQKGKGKASKQEPNEEGHGEGGRH